MKAIKKVLAILVCVCVVLGCTAFSAFAAEPAYGSITIQNQSGTNATIGGKTLNLFRIFKAEYSDDKTSIFYDWVLEDNGDKRFYSVFFGTNGLTGKDSGTIHDVVEYINSIKNDAANFSIMTSAIHSYIHTNQATIMDVADTDNYRTSGNIPGTSTSYTFSDLPLGYYVIFDATEFDPADPTPAVRSAAMLAHPDENKVIWLKADRPHIEKYVNDNDDYIKGTGEANWLTGTSANIGDIVEFRIATSIPNHAHYDDYVFEISDTMESSLKLEGEVNVNVTYPTNTTNTTVADYTLTKNVDGSGFKLVVNNTLLLDEDTIIEITYRAKLLTNADALNTNSVTLTYSNDPNNDDSRGTVTDTVDVTALQLTLTKHYEDPDTGAPSYVRLAGAKFQIFSAEDGYTNPLKFTTTKVTGANSVEYDKYIYDPEGGTVVELETLNESGTDDGKTDVGKTDGGYLGQILIFGLGEGDYVIRETQAPKGYQSAVGDFKVVVTDDIGPAGTLNDIHISATRDDPNAAGKFFRVEKEPTQNKYYIGITNRPGSALPETGGIGTTIFTVIGIIMMAGAFAFFTSRKRSRAV